MVRSTTRMLRVGVVADARWDTAVLHALPKLIRATGLDSIWCSARAPTGPLPYVAFAELIASAGRLGVTTRADRDLARWNGGPLPSDDDGVRPVLVSARPERSLAQLLGMWQIEGGSPDRLVVEVPVSIGRTRGEAEARATAWFADLGSPRDHGLFGTLEDCQAQAGALAAIGLRHLRCVLPGSDIPDVIAQLSAVGIGSVETQGPAAGRSPSPPPPPGWGGPGRTRT